MNAVKTTGQMIDEARKALAYTTDSREGGAMAYRWRLVQEIRYGHFGEFMKTWARLDSIMRERGWVSSRVLVPTAGPNNQFVAEFEYPDLATYERENRAFYADPEAFRAFRAGAEFVVQGTARTELYEDLPLEFFQED